MTRALKNVNYLGAVMAGKAKGILEENGMLIVGVVLLFIFRDAATVLIQTLTTFAGEKVKALFQGI